MTNNWNLLAVLLVLVTTGCGGPDLPSQPGYVSTGRDRVALVAPSATAGTGAMKAPQHHPYFVEFRSRYALTYGHTYVVFGRVNGAGQVVSREVAGLHPTSYAALPYMVGHFVPVPAETGWSDGDLEEQYRSASWRVMLDETDYRKTLAYIRKLQASSRVWQASVYNCNAFTGDIASFMGYKTPSRYLRPQQFVTQLREMNTRAKGSG